MPTQDKYAHWRALIAANKITKLLQELREELAKSDRLDEIIQQSARYSALRKNIRLGVISYDDGRLTEAQIQAALAEFLTEMEELERTDEVVARQLAHRPAENLASTDPHFLTPKPQKPEIFVGREDELEELHEMLFAAGADHFLLVNGEGGIGKTTLASAYFYRYHQEYAHAAWVLGETSIAGALLTLAVGLNLEFGPTEDTDQRLHRLMTRLANLNQPCLLVVDNANSLEDLDANYEILRRCDNFHLLLTSRLREYQRARLVPVDPLETDTAEDLFATHYRPLDEAESQLFNAIYEAVGGNTLVLEILAKNLKRVNTLRERYTLTNLLRDLQEKGLLQLVESRAVDTSYGKLRRAKPEEIIGAMYELEDLTDPQLKLLSVFAVLPPDKIPVAHLEVLLDDFAELEEPLLDLAQRGWVEFDAGTGSFRCSPVVQLVVKKKHENWRSVTPLLRSEINEQLVTYEGGHIKIGIQAARPFATYGEAIAPYLPEERQNIFFYQQLAHFYNSSGDLRTNMEWIGRMASLSKALLAENEDDADLKNDLAISYEKLGLTHSSLGNLAKALEYFEVETDLFKELRGAYPNNVGFKDSLAISYSRLGETHSSLGNLAKALEYFKQYNTMEKELHGAYPDNVGFKNGLAISYERLGSTHSSLGNMVKALEYFEVETSLFEDLYVAYSDNVDFKKGLAVSYQNLGDTFIAQDNLKEALDHYVKYNELAKEIHAAHPINVDFKNGLAFSYTKLGGVAEDPVQKRAQYQKAKQLWVELTEAFPDYAEFQSNLEWVKTQLSKL